MIVERREGFGLRQFAAYALKVWVAAGVAVAVAAGGIALVSTAAGWYGQLAELTLGGLLVVAVYALISGLLRLPEMATVWRRFRRSDR